MVALAPILTVLDVLPMSLVDTRRPRRLRDQVRLFAMEMAPAFTPDELDGLPAYHMAIKTLVDNQQAPPFEAAVPPIPRGNPDHARRIRQMSRRACGKPRAEIEAIVAERYGEPDERDEQGDAGEPDGASRGSNGTHGRSDGSAWGEADAPASDQRNAK